MRSLAELGARHARTRPGLTVLRLAAVVLGVALSVAVMVATASTVDALHRAEGTHDLRGDVVALTLGGQQRLADDDIAAISALPGVGHVEVVAAPLATGDGARDRVVITLADGVGVDQWLEEHSASVTGLRLVSVEQMRADALEDLGGIEATLPSATALGLLVGGYLIHLTFRTASVERRGEYGLLRALGCTHRDVRRVVLAEALVVGLIGTVLGLAAGVVLSEGVARSLAGVAGVEPDRRVVPSAGLLLTAALGLMTPLVAAWGPARRAARLEPAEALRGPTEELLRPTRTWVVGAALLAAGVTTMALSSRSALADQLMRAAGAPVVLGGAILMVPRVLPPVANSAQPLVARLLPGVGEIAMRHVTRERSRSAYTSGIMMVVLAMVMTFGAMVGSWRPVVVDQVEEQFGADLVVRAVDGEDLAGLVEVLAADDAVGAADARARGDVQIVGPQRAGAPLLGIDPARHFQVSGLDWTDAGVTDEGIAAELAAGDAVVLPELLRAELGVAVGDSLQLLTTAGVQDRRVVATYVTFGAGDSLSVVVDRDDAHRSFGVGAVSEVGVDVADGADPTEVTEVILASTPAEVEVETAADEQRVVLDRIDGVLGLVLMVAVVMLLVGILAVASTMTVSVLSRVREIGVLRAIGVRRREVRSMVLVESAVLVVVASVLGIALGTWLGWIMVSGIAQDFETDIPFAIPWPWTIVGVLTATVAALLASLAPSRRAAELEPVEALHHE